MDEPPRKSSSSIVINTQIVTVSIGAVITIFAAVMLLLPMRGAVDPESSTAMSGHGMLVWMPTILICDLFGCIEMLRGNPGTPHWYQAVMLALAVNCSICFLIGTVIGFLRKKP